MPDISNPDRKKIKTQLLWLCTGAVALAVALWFGGLLPGVAPPKIPMGGLLLLSLAMLYAAAGLFLLFRWRRAGGDGVLRRQWPYAVISLLAGVLFALVMQQRLAIAEHPVQFIGCLALFGLGCFTLLAVAARSTKRRRLVPALLLSAVFAVIFLTPFRIQQPGNTDGTVWVAVTTFADEAALPQQPLVVGQVQAFERVLEEEEIQTNGFTQESGMYTATQPGATLRFQADAAWYAHLVFESTPIGWGVEINSGNQLVRQQFTGEEETPYTLTYITEPATSYGLTALITVALGLFFGFGLACIGVALPALRPGKKAKEKKKLTQKRLARKALYYTMGALQPVIFLLALLRANFSYLSGGQVAVCALAGALLSVALQFMLGRLFGNLRSAFWVLLFFWGLFFTFNNLFTALSETCLLLNLGIFCALCLAVLLLGGVWLAWLGKKLKRPEAYKALAVVLAVVLLLNLAPVVVLSMQSRGYMGGEYRTDFVVDENTPSPNIYWFHIDGMMSFAGMEALFSEDQSHFEAQLEDRGFILNRDAWFESGHTTTVAVLELMSPQYYENKLAPMINGADTGTEAGYDELVGTLRNPALAEEIQEAQINNETLKAFKEKGYHTSAITYSDLTIYKTVDTFYSMADIDHEKPVLIPRNDKPDKQQMSLIEMENLVNLLTSATALSLAKQPLDAFLMLRSSSYYQHEALTWPAEEARAILGDGYETAGEIMVRSLGQVLESPEPRFAVVHNVLAHTPYIYDENGYRIAGQVGAEFQNYLAQHRYAIRVLMDTIDMVLAADPGAVVVLQSDHGLHGTKKEELQAAGITELSDIKLAWNGAISAVRIPDEWGGQDGVLDPLNIARLLINRYVGENYALLPEDQPNQRG